MQEDFNTDDELDKKFRELDQKFADYDWRELNGKLTPEEIAEKKKIDDAINSFGERFKAFEEQYGKNDVPDKKVDK